MEDSELRKMVQKNIEMTEEILGLVKSIKRHIFWETIFGVLKILIILVPIVLGIIYLPPLLKIAFEQYRELLGLTMDPVNNIKLEDLKSLVDPKLLK